MRALFLRSATFAFLYLLLLLTSSACTTNFHSQIISGTPTSTPTALRPTPTRTSTPFQVTPAVPTKPAPPGFLFFTHGDGFLVAYPNDWSSPSFSLNSTGYTDSVNFDDATSNENFYVYSSPGSSNQAPLSTIAHDCALNIIFGPPSDANIQSQQIPATRVVNGVLWYQSEVEANLGPDDRAMYVCLATRHRSGTDPNAIFTLAYSAEVSLFSQLDTATFEPMIQSFEFLT